MYVIVNCNFTKSCNQNARAAEVQFAIAFLRSKSCKTPLKFLRKKVFKLHIFFCGGYR